MRRRSWAIAWLVLFSCGDDKIPLDFADERGRRCSGECEEDGTGCQYVCESVPDWMCPPGADYSWQLGIAEGDPGFVWLCGGCNEANGNRTIDETSCSAIACASDAQCPVFEAYKHCVEGRCVAP
jgi:hypothetical protein